MTLGHWLMSIDDHREQHELCPTSKNFSVLFKIPDQEYQLTKLLIIDMDWKVVLMACHNRSPTDKADQNKIYVTLGSVKWTLWITIFSIRLPQRQGKMKK